MTTSTEQMEHWAGQFGKNYTDRNPFTVAELDASYMAKYGKTRTALNEQVLAGIDRASKILEVGSNVGTQLLCLQQMGFQRLYGIEIQQYAVERSKSRTTQINIIEGSAFDIPFKDGYFDLVFTSGVLIHINPADIDVVLQEIYRCTRKYIWGLEYYADTYTEIPYRWQNNLLWKANFVKLYRDKFQDLEVVKEECLPYLNGDNTDTMFLLCKRP